MQFRPLRSSNLSDDSQQITTEITTEVDLEAQQKKGYNKLTGREEMATKASSDSIDEENMEYGK